MQVRHRLTAATVTCNAEINSASRSLAMTDVVFRSFCQFSIGECATGKAEAKQGQEGEYAERQDHGSVRRRALAGM